MSILRRIAYFGELRNSLSFLRKEFMSLLYESIFLVKLAKDNLKMRKCFCVITTIRNYWSTRNIM